MGDAALRESRPVSDERGLRFRVLGQVRVHRDGVPVDLGTPLQRALLTLLLASPGQPWEVERIVDALWGEEPPVSAQTLVYRYVGALRRILDPGLPSRTSGGLLVRGAGGYRMEVDGDSLDLLRFRALAQDARRLCDDGLTRRGVTTYLRALALWQGHPLDGLPRSATTVPVFQALDRERHAVVKEAADAAQHCGLIGELLGPLRRCTAERPLDEPLHARLLSALVATGRAPEALRAFHAVKSRLAHGLGIEPGPELRAAARHVLAPRSATTSAAEEHLPPAAESTPQPVDSPAPSAASPRPPAPPASWPVPAQLPAGPRVFIRRRRTHASLPDPDGTGGGPAGTIVLTGPAGVGKTALALHWAHRAAGRFPDGRLHANLRGHAPDGPPADPAVVLSGFLRALGVAPDDIPADDLARRYQQALAGRRVLVLLDDARDAAQIADLLPAAPGCLAVVTSRASMREAAGGPHPVRHVGLEPFDAAEAREFLVARLGAERVTAGESAVATLIGLTRGLPSTLASVAARALTVPAFPLAALVEETRAAVDDGVCEAEPALGARRPEDPRVDVSPAPGHASADAAEPPDASGSSGPEPGRPYGPGPSLPAHRGGGGPAARPRRREAVPPCRGAADMLSALATGTASPAVPSVPSVPAMPSVSAVPPVPVIPPFPTISSVRAVPVPVRGGRPPPSARRAPPRR